MAKKALQIFIPFVTTHLCEQSFSRMLDTKMKKRNRLCCENDMRVVLAKVKPRISELAPGRQQQKSHRFAANIHHYIFCSQLELSSDTPPKRTNYDKRQLTGSRECFHYKLEEKILAMQTEQKLSYGQAKRNKH
ncbi:hypothetical protein FHG87_013814 [Trinorchestia longiramus]|nr:hypothetical protein FHG87_013814 [Trinorchestia longiramus]